MQIQVTPRLKARRGVEVKVGHVYATKQGINGYFVVVGVSHPGKNERPFNNVHMVRFAMTGDIVGCKSEPEAYVQNHKDLVGEIKDGMPTLTVEWYE